MLQDIHKYIIAGGHTGSPTLNIGNNLNSRVYSYAWAVAGLRNAPVLRILGQEGVVMKTALAVFLLLASLSVAAQYRAAAMKASSASPLQKDLNRCLAELERVAVNTDSDVARLKTELPKSTWKTAWLSSRSRRQETHTADTLQHNLENVVPARIRDVQASRGSVAPAIKLYNDVNSTYELLDSLIGSAQNHAKNVDTAPLITDRTSMGRIRQNLSAYIQNASASMETGRQSAANGQPVRKIVVDDNVPDKTAKK